jgi:seryl-tRNA synthetase
MHDIRWVRDNADAFQERLIARGIAEGEAKATLDQLVELDERRRSIIGRLQTMQERRNAASKEVGQAKASKDEARAQALIDEVAKLKGDLATAEGEEREIDKALETALAQIPNLPLMDVPVGADEHDNVEYRRFGEAPSLGFTAKQHFDIGEAQGGMDFESASKLSGARFVVLKKGIARLERAIGQFMLDLHTNEHGYT